MACLSREDENCDDETVVLRMACFDAKAVNSLSLSLFVTAFFPFTRKDLHSACSIHQALYGYSTG